MKGKSQEAAAAAAGMSVRSARKWESGPLPSTTKKARSWRTRKDPFKPVWESFVVPLLKADTEGKLEAKTVVPPQNPVDRTIGDVSSLGVKLAYPHA